MLRISLKDDGIEAGLNRLAAEMTDLSKVMNRIGAQLVRSTKDRIGRGVSPDGSPFAPRSSNTLRRYDAKRLSYAGVLHRSGEMQEGIFHAYGPHRVEVGSNAIQSAVMQFGADMGAFGATRRGSPIPYGPIPARPFLGLSDDDREAINDLVVTWLERAAAGRS